MRKESRGFEEIAASIKRALESREELKSFRAYARCSHKKVLQNIIVIVCCHFTKVEVLPWIQLFDVTGRCCNNFNFHRDVKLSMTGPQVDAIPGDGCPSKGTRNLGEPNQRLETDLRPAASPLESWP
jgi:hypothetical protein